jgi:hypothetical protein
MLRGFLSDTGRIASRLVGLPMMTGMLGIPARLNLD